MTQKNRKGSPRDQALAAFKSIAPREDEDLADAKAPRTFIQYRSAWTVFERWCEEHSHTPLPASAEVLRAYVRHLSEKSRSSSTIDAYIAAIATVHRLNGHALDRTPLIEPMKAARRRAGPRRKARALLKAALRDLIGRLDITDARDARDGAITLLSYGAALRSSECVGLDWSRAGGSAHGGTGIVSPENQGFLVTLLTSKASQLTPVDLAIPDREMPTLRPWLEAWASIAGVSPGTPLFRPIDRRGVVRPTRLSSRAVAYIVRRRMLAHALAIGKEEIDAIAWSREFSSHSMRRGYCTTAANARVPLSQIRPRSRHGSDATLGEYIASAEGWSSSGLEGVGF